MLNVRLTLLSIFGILFIFSISFTTFAQQEQQSDAALSQSQFVQIIDRIDKSKEEIRKHVDEKFDRLDKKIDEKFSELDKKIDELNEDVAFINGQLTIIKWSITIFGAPLLVGLIIYYLQNRKKKANTTTDVATKVPAESREESDEDIGRGNLTDNQQSEFA